MQLEGLDVYVALAAVFSVGGAPLHRKQQPLAGAHSHARVLWAIAPLTAITCVVGTANAGVPGSRWRRWPGSIEGVNSMLAAVCSDGGIPMRRGRHQQLARAHTHTRMCGGTAQLAAIACCVVRIGNFREGESPGRTIMPALEIVGVARAATCRAGGAPVRRER